jgi:sphingomyelin phosphodiesterase
MLTCAQISPSLTPLSNLNSGFRAYDVDPETFNILDAYTFVSNISAAATLDGQTARGAAFTFEYSAREAYGGNIAWPADAPLNATWWHRVTEAWAAEPALVQLFTTFQGKNSVRTTNCTSATCVESKICYARSGSYRRLPPFRSLGLSPRTAGLFCPRSMVSRTDMLEYYLKLTFIKFEIDWITRE